MGASVQSFPLTADIMARAVIAAAASYGDDPIKAMEPGKGSHRRCLAAVIDGLAEVTGLGLRALCGPLQVNNTSVSRARGQGREAFRTASRAASRAASYAGWRPEARASLAAGQGSDDLPVVEVEPAAVEPEIQPPPKAPLPGRLMAHTRPPPLISTASVASAERPVRDLVLEALAKGPLNSMSLAYQVDSKEMTVSSTLTQLEHEGLVVSEPVAEGPRRLRWTLTARDLAA